MQTITRSKTGTGQSTVLVPDWKLNPFNVGIQCVLSGTATFSVEYTLDSEDATQSTWTAVTGLSGVSASTNALHQIPCRGYRINVTAGTGTVTATFCQAGRR